MVSIFLNYLCDSDTLTSAQTVRTETMIDNHGNKLLDLVAKAVAVVAVEVFLVFGLVLIAHLEIVGEPPGGGHVDIPTGAGNDEVALSLHADAHSDGGDGVGKVDDGLGENVNAITHLGVERDVVIVDAEEFDDGE